MDYFLERPERFPFRMFEYSRNLCIAFADAIPMKGTYEEFNSLQDYYVRHDKQCPFLDQNKRCIIYEIRPGMCASYKHYGNVAECDKAIAEKGVSYHKLYDNVLNSLIKFLKITKSTETTFVPYFIYTRLRDLKTGEINPKW